MYFQKVNALFLNVITITIITIISSNFSDGLYC